METIIITFTMQVDELKKDSKGQQKEKEALEARANEADKKMSELRVKLESVGFLLGRIHANARFCFVLCFLSSLIKSFLSHFSLLMVCI